MSKFGVSVRLLDATDKVFREVYFKQYALKSKLLSIEKDIVLERVLEGFSAVVGNQPILPTDNIIQAFCKIQSTINYIMTGGFAQLQSDWAQTNNLLVDFIKNKPTLLSQFINDTGFITISSIPTDISDLTDLTGIIPTDTNDLTNSAGFITSSSLPSDISDLTDITGIIPTDTNDLTNGAGFITITDIPFIPTDVADLTDSTGIIPTDTGDLTNGAGFITLGDIPFIPSDISDLTDTTGIIPTNTSDLTNDSNFIVDASYVHTDNNYSNTEKQKVADCETMRDIMSDASKGLFFYDNFTYVKQQTVVGTVGLSYYTLNNSARSQNTIIDTGYGKKLALNLNTYTNALGYATVNAVISVIPNYGVLTFETRIKIPVLSVAAQRFACYIGLQNGITSAPTDYIRFEYSDNLNSGKFLCVSCVGGVTTTSDSLITAVADTWYIMQIVSNSDATSIAFYIDGNLVATITTNIPSAVYMHTVNQIIKSVGTTQRDLYVDYVKCFQIYN
jgi:hypothetical protein